VKTAIITGIYGQDGTLLARDLLAKGYQVVGITQKIRPDLTQRLKRLCGEFEILSRDLRQRIEILKLIEEYSPDEIYNLAGLSQILECEKYPIEALQTNTEIPLNFLSCIMKSNIRFYQATSSEIFGNCDIQVQNEQTPIKPRNFYGVTKAAAHFAVGHFRTQYNIFACSGILFNHESEFRGHEMVTSKIIDNLLRIKLTTDKSRFSLGNVDSKRDWGFAGDYVKAMWLMLQQDSSDDYVVATNSLHSVNDFLKAALRALELDEDIERYVYVDEKLIRKNEEGLLQGDYSKIKNSMGWEPSIDFDSLVLHLVQSRRP
jgi:GDPmannose 4,6-dehydratase